MQLSRLAVIISAVACCFLGRIGTFAQTNVITLCTENDLIFAFAEGGEHFMDCGTNIVSITLAEPIVATKNITIRTTNEVVITGNNLTRLMVVNPGIKVTLEGFSFFSGRQSETNLNHGGIEETAGGAIYNNGGILTIRRGRFQANSVVGIAGAAGADGEGEDGEAGGDAAGAAIYNTRGGTVVVSNVIFQANTALGGVGGKGGNARTSGLGDNGGNGGQGGSAAGAAIYSDGGRLEVYACVFTNNVATGAIAGAAGNAGGVLGNPGLPGEAGDGVGGAIAGGGLANAEARIIVSASTFVTNTVRGANGLNGNTGVGRNDGDNGLNGGEASGGAIYSTGMLSVTNSTFFRNGGVSGNGGNGGTGSTGGFGFSGGDGGNGGVAAGGAIESSGSTTVLHCTFADNGVTGGTGGTGGTGSGLGESGEAGSKGAALGGAVYGSATTAVDGVHIVNSILVNSRPSIEGMVIDNGGNITTDRNLLMTTNSFSPANPFLQPLANNGGPTPTMRIGTNSFAINRGLAAYCVAIDQRGTNRVGPCDIGAYELVPPASLGVVQTNNTVVLSWPVGNTNLTLQGTTNLLRTNTVWKPVTNAVVIQTNFLNVFTVTPNPAVSRGFYRLFDTWLATNSTSTNVLPPFPF
jgi:hypothetical protein